MKDIYVRRCKIFFQFQMLHILSYSTTRITFVHSKQCEKVNEATMVSRNHTDFQSSLSSSDRSRPLDPLLLLDLQFKPFTQVSNVHRS